MPAYSATTSSRNREKTGYDDEALPPAYEENARPAVPEGLYVITNRRSRLVLDLRDGESRDGALCYAYTRNNNDCIDHQFWIVKQNGSNGAYTLQNIRGGHFLSLPWKLFSIPLKQQVTEPIICHAREPKGTNRLNQEWHIQTKSTGSYAIQSARTHKFLDVRQGWLVNSLLLSPGSEENEGQVWDLERVSRTTQEIRTILCEWRPHILSRLFQPYPDDAQYFLLPHELRKAIWEREGLHQHGSVQYAFDYDDFVTKAKAAANSWARYRFRVGGYSALFGVVYGEAKKGPRAYNWYLAPDMRSLVFFDAQTGKEYTQTTLEEFEFEPTFATF
ncbi:carbohydrate-binding module family 13 protein [Tulasnella calospora MUT 4182]|uniref:Carbohydrate-binding module family 13 protein n=1 Tax=Tulasnella calospora MUT 4182 TaxID=1051891 RepID=A0A0C3QDT0_9AGAM|nr:carbohydrate-binding module family 13 protein [Tulasnella calospora MUT 4182]